MTTAAYKMAKTQSSVAMVVALVSWMMLFAALFLSYAVFRFQQPMWPPMGMDKISLLWPLMSTLFVALSSVLFELSKKSYVNNNVNKYKNYLYLSFLFGVSFLLSQLQVWKTLNLSGIAVDTGVYASILHGFTWIHAAHIALGMCGFIFLWKYTRKPFDQMNIITIDNVGKFWHFMGFIWLIMFVVLFVI